MKNEKGLARDARKAAALMPKIKASRKRPNHEDALYRWAKRYDDLNGAPESDEDR